MFVVLSLLFEEHEPLARKRVDSRQCWQFSPVGCEPFALTRSRLTD